MFEEILAGLASRLREAEIPYMVIGGLAVLLYGEPRMTRDIDVTLGVTPDRLADVLRVVESLSLRPLVDDPASFVSRTMVLPVIHERTGVRVDLIFSFTGYESQAIERATRVEVLDEEVCFASVEDLVIHKLFAARPRDLEDVVSVLKRHPDLDVDYVRGWLREFQAAMPEEHYLKNLENTLRRAAEPGAGRPTDDGGI
ncbi:MAG: nucleotidyl transferase AbiEii/AbiGii toxin family protein [Actinobacteria bacterium]|nr:nucleotidyl transferase AbiEii/AbiGii toxin family protein [Actinomycetota bacterium]MBU1944362.1 nucleotidyl transferase AbiEii/AbiGii toxin family protein [Actinomycetota bacterium]MBU2688161.1 nucleotidyl transferase AbiEii/AbiGii toxin family protein [Actinomycetota bacterium]